MRKCHHSSCRFVAVRKDGLVAIEVEECLAIVSERLPQLPLAREPGSNKLMELNATELTAVISSMDAALKNTMGVAYDRKKFQVRKAEACQVS
jgi:hypothetical protein